jgi:hypothetical protein
MVETLLLRRLDLSPTVRQQSAKRIANHLCTKLDERTNRKPTLRIFSNLWFDSSGNPLTIASSEDIGSASK